ncbi:MAG: ATP-binding protein [Methylocystis sp.]|uniref:ATP-binding protein n=1 Tax=Methylocystis sp. TaxID=1911079 RepID=UPI003DA27C22
MMIAAPGMVLFLLLACGLLLWRHRAVEQLRREVALLRGAADGREKAEAASLAKSRFLATVSHEIRTPLNGVSGLAQLLSMTRLDAEQTSYVDAIAESSRALAQLIDDILDFSQIEAGRLALRQETFALAPLVEGVVELLAPRAQGKGLEIASFISPHAPRDMIGDPARLRQVLINLVGNAVHYTPHGGVGLRVHHDGAALRFDVCDSGPGVPDSARQKIFEEFERADASATQRQGGAGLGLAISQRLVGLMGGTLALSETSAAGSTFSVFLPLAERASAVPERPLEGQRVLIVAEGPFEAPCLAETLSTAGARPMIDTFERAVARLAQDGVAAYDVVIADCALGQSAIAALAARARSAAARRVLLLFSPLERRPFGEAALCDVDGWLVKPVRRDSLLACLAEDRPEARDGAVAAGAFPALHGLTALIAEDNDINALILTRGLGKLGACVTRVRNGAEAVEKATVGTARGAAPYDVILMDLFMPELDGRAATRLIREAEARAGARRTPIVALTASAFEQDARAACSAGVDVLLTKPVDLTVLAATLDALRQRSAAQVGAPGYAPVGAMAPNLPER